MASKTIERKNRILDFVQRNPDLSSADIHAGLGKEFGYATLKRALQSLVNEKMLVVSGNTRSTRYRISETFQLLGSIDLDSYFKKETDERTIKKDFNQEIFRLLKQAEIFTAEESKQLNQLQERYRKNIESLSETEYHKEMERLAIDLSWKSSQIEGNTYSLLETERLLKEQETAAGKTRDEATMLLNHKEALDFIVKNPEHINPLSVTRLEEIHSILIKDLNVERNLRRRRVGISGTNYRPLDNEFKIREALEDSCRLINAMDDAFSKAFLALILISYIQGFSDGNKRTARIVSNAILISKGYCPLSFRTVDPIMYKKAMLLFYEQNNLTAFKRIFIEQFRFAVDTYF